MLLHALCTAISLLLHGTSSELKSLWTLKKEMIIGCDEFGVTVWSMRLKPNTYFFQYNFTYCHSYLLVAVLKHQALSIFQKEEFTWPYCSGELS